MLDKIKRYIPLFVALLSFLVFLYVFFLYLDKQFLLNMESNHLLTDHHVKIINKEDLNDISNEIEKFSYWKLSVLEEAGSKVVYAFDSNHYKNCKLPLKEGRLFEKENSKEAIVGYATETIMRGDSEYFRYNNYDYKVVGKIGVSQFSQIEHYAIINDKDYFDDKNSAIYIDSLDEYKMNLLKEKYDLFRENFGIERWFNMKYYMNIIKTIGFLLIMSVSFIISNILYKLRKEKNLLLNSIGYDVFYFVFKDCLYFLGINYVIYLIISLLFYNLNDMTRIYIFSFDIVMLLIVFGYYSIKTKFLLKGEKKCF